MMRRLPIRWRLTLLYAVLMTLVLTAAGVVLFAKFSADIYHTVDLGLRSRAETIEATAGPAGANFGEGNGLIEPDVAFTQILGLDGTVLDSSAKLDTKPLLSPEAAAAVDSPTFWDAAVGVGEEPISARLLAVPTSDGAVIVVGASLEDQHAALSRLSFLLVAGIPIAVASTTILAWLLAGGALHPIERMRREAEGLTEQESLGERLSVPPTGDEVARLGTTLNAMLDRLQKTTERERRLVDDASHELRTPLGILRGELELALRPDRSRDELEDAVASGVEETDRLIGLAEALLVLSRIRETAPTGARPPVDLAALVAETVSSFEIRAQAAGIGLDLDGDRRVDARVDPLQIRQLATNLIDNAINHTPEGGRVTVELASKASEAILRVSDSGDGFDEGFLPMAFEPFARADRSRSRGSGGAGLGLAIVGAIVSSIGGTVVAKNRPEGGAMVECTIPVGGPT
jgi:signal transduction histidine kinase